MVRAAVVDLSIGATTQSGDEGWTVLQGARKHRQREAPMIIVNCAQFLEHVKIGTVFWYLCSHDGEYTLHGPHIAEKFLEPSPGAPMWRVLTWLVSVSNQSVFGASQEETANLLQEITTVDDFFHNSGIVMTSEVEANACHLGTILQHGTTEVKAAG
jgi:hypothetical protein